MNQKLWTLIQIKNHDTKTIEYIVTPIITFNNNHNTMLCISPNGGLAQYNVDNNPIILQESLETFCLLSLRSLQMLIGMYQTGYKGMFLILGVTLSISNNVYFYNEDGQAKLNMDARILIEELKHMLKV